MRQAINQNPIKSLVLSIAMITISLVSFTSYYNIFPSAHAAATITVNSTADNTTAGDGNCTLREALGNAKTNSDTTSGDCVAGSGTDTIEFSITGSGPHNIVLGSDLDSITDPVVIDGTSEPDYTTSPVVHIDGDSMASQIFSIAAATTIQGLSITDGTADGIILTTGADNSVIKSNYIGVEPDGTTTNGPSTNNILINSGIDGVTIGGTSSSDRNVIVDGAFGIAVNSTDTDVTNLTIQGNYIGLLPDGSTIAANGTGVVFQDGLIDGATIGGSTAGARNVISGNTSDGIYGLGTLGDPMNDITIQGNYIGTNANGDVDKGNGNSGSDPGVSMVHTTNLVIGGDTANKRNIISGGAGYGINIGGSTTTAVIQGNYIGLSADGTTAIGNDTTGINLDDYSTLTIGGTGANEGNVISGNSGGIEFRSTVSSVGSVQGNLIGVDPTGNTAIANSGTGVMIGTTSVITIGGSTSARNIISGNTGDGVSVTGDGGNAIIRSNYIGVDIDGDTAIPNGEMGVNISGDSNTIGGTTAGQGNVISGNTASGIQLINASGSTFEGNYIGVAADGTSALGNGQVGISVIGGPNMVGGTTAGTGNIIANNDAGGVLAIDLANGATGISILGNNIYSNSAGTLSGGINTDGLGIDLLYFSGSPANVGVTANDDGDGDTTGVDDISNNGQNYPVIASSTGTSAGETLTVTYDTTSFGDSDGPYTIEFFMNSDNNGEGEQYVGRETITSLSATEEFTVVLPDPLVGDYVTATATYDTTGDTSEFSATVQSASDATAPTLAIVTPVTTPTGDNTPDFTFSTDEDGDITYGGDCSSGDTAATAGNNTITFNVLADGAHSNCTVTVTDAATNASDALAVPSFTVDTAGPTATLTVGTTEIDLDDLVQEVTVTYDETMDTDTDPTISFSIGVFSSNGDGEWTSSTVYTESFTHNGSTQVAEDVEVSSSGAQDSLENEENDSINGTFNIDTAVVYVVPINNGGGGGGSGGSSGEGGNEGEGEDTEDIIDEITTDDYMDYVNECLFLLEKDSDERLYSNEAYVSVQGQVMTFQFNSGVTVQVDFSNEDFITFQITGTSSATEYSLILGCSSGSEKTVFDDVEDAFDKSETAELPVSEDEIVEFLEKKLAERLEEGEGEEGDDELAAESDSECPYDCDDISYSIYIVNPDGERVIMGSKKTKVRDYVNGAKRVYFEDGVDNDFNDVIVEVYKDCAGDVNNISFDVIGVDAAFNHEVHAILLYKGEIIEDFVAWRDSHDSKVEFVVDPLDVIERCTETTETGGVLIKLAEIFTMNDKEKREQKKIYGFASVLSY